MSCGASQAKSRRTAALTFGKEVGPVATPKEVAEWMIAQLEADERLLQVDAVATIEKVFGPEFVYISDIGEKSIDRRVLYTSRGHK
jgi:hypothetical protein